MSKLSDKTLEIVRDHIANALYDSYPKEVSTFFIASSIGRNKELVRRLLSDLKKIGVVQEISKDKRGFPFVGSRRKWKLKFEYVQAIQKG
jgi:ribosomal protein S25